MVDPGGIGGDLQRAAIPAPWAGEELDDVRVPARGRFPLAIEDVGFGLRRGGEPGPGDAQSAGGGGREARGIVLPLVRARGDINALAPTPAGRFHEHKDVVGRALEPTDEDIAAGCRADVK